MDAFNQFVAGRPMVAKSAPSVEMAMKTCSVCEPKYDGQRAFLIKYPNGEWDVLSRTLKSQKGKMPHIDEIVKNLPNGTILDGEAILFHGGKKGILSYQGNPVEIHCPDFHDTMKIMGSSAEKAARRQVELGTNVSVVVFDMPWIAGQDISQVTLFNRRKMMQPVIDNINHPNLTMSPLVDLTQENIDKVFELGGEGLMAKNLGVGSEYHPGARTKSWMKIKFEMTSDTVITGYTNGEGKYSHLFGAIIYGQYKDGKLVERGRCSGITDELRNEMHNNRAKYIGRVMEIKHMGIAKDGPRHPRFVTLRDDKLATDCEWEEAGSASAVKPKIASTPKRSKRAKPSATQGAVVKTAKTTPVIKTAKIKHVFDKANCEVEATLRNTSGGSNKYYSGGVNRENGEYVSWVKYGKWSDDTNSPLTETAAPLSNHGDDLDGAVASANIALRKKLGTGYRGELIEAVTA